MQNTDKPRQVKGFLCEQFDGESFLYHPDQTQAIYLNDVAALIWTLCDGNKTVGDLQTMLVEAYPEQAGQIPEDLREALDQLSGCGSIET